MTKTWVKVATIGAKAGTDLTDSGGNVLADSAVKNSSIALGISGTGLTLTNAGSGVTLSNSSVGLGSVANVDMRNLDNATGGTLASARGGTGITNFANSTHANTNTTKANVGLPNVEDANLSTIRAGTTKTDVGLANVPNTDATNASNIASGSLAVARAAAGLVNTNTTKTDVGLANVPNTDATNASNIGSGTLAVARAASGLVNTNTTKSDVGLGNVDNNSTATIRNGVTTYVVDKGTSIIWTNISGQMSPNDTTYDWTITWRNGSGTSLGATVIRTALNGTTALSGMSTQSDGASATINLGGATSAGSTQTTTVTVNSVTVSLTAKIIDGSGWGFK